MKKNTTKNTNLSKYTAVAGAVVAAGAVNAQVGYTDVNPDVVLDKNAATPYGIDFNGDATDDVLFQVQANVGSGTFPYTTSGGSVLTIDYTIDASYDVAAGMVLGSGTGTNFAVNALNTNDVIGAAGVFGGTSGALLGYAGSYTLPAYGASGTFTGGNFLGAGDKFLGAKFMAGANTHYGWVRISVAADASTITIKDYAFQAQPGVQILAGQTASIENFAVENKVTIKTTLEEAVINVTPDLIGGSIVITDMAGKEVKTSAINDVNAKISYTGLKTGVYFVEARFEAGSVNKKVYVK